MTHFFAYAKRTILISRGLKTILSFALVLKSYNKLWVRTIKHKID